MRLALGLLLGAIALAPLDAQQNTTADSADARCVVAKFDTLRYANGNGRRNNLASQGQACAARWLTRVDSAKPPTPPPDTVVPPPPAPVAALAGACALLTCSFDATASTGPRISYAWACGHNCAPGNVGKFTHQYGLAGSLSVSVTVTDSLNRKSSTSKVFTIPGIPDSVVTPLPPIDTVTPLPPTDTTATPARAELPRSVPAFTVPAPARVYTVTTDFQRALDTAKVGDEMRLGANFVGNFVLPGRASCSGWITIRSVAEPPAAGTRVTPATAAAFAKVTSPNTAPAIKTTNPTCNWRLLGIEITGTQAPTSIQYGLLWLGDGGWTGGGETQTDSSKVPRNFILDRIYLNGAATNTTRCLALNTAATVIRDSWFGNCHGSGFDSQAIAGWNGPGPYLIENNTLEGAGENVMFGGADPGINGMVPSDITIRRNHFYKPRTWQGVWTVKNSFELKTARRTLVEANVFENNWPSAQEGVMVVIKSNANGCQCAFLGTTDLTMRWNHMKNAPVGLGLQAADDSYGWTGFIHTQRVTIENNLWENIGAEGSRQSLMLFTHDLKDIELAHNTFVHATTAGGLVLPMAYSFGAARRVTFRDNVFTDKAGYAFHNSDNGSIHTNALNAFVNDRSWRFERNVVGGMLPDYVSQNPPASWYPSTIAGIGFAADWSLSAASPYKGKGLNGADPGADVATIAQRTAGVVVPSGVPVARAVGVPRPSVPTITARDRERLARQPRSLP